MVKQPYPAPASRASVTSPRPRPLPTRTVAAFNAPVPAVKATAAVAGGFTSTLWRPAVQPTRQVLTVHVQQPPVLLSSARRLGEISIDSTRHCRPRITEG